MCINNKLFSIRNFYLLASVFLVFTSNVYAKEPSELGFLYKQVIDAPKNNSYNDAISKAIEVNDKYKGDQQSRFTINQPLTTLYSYVGQYEKAISFPTDVPLISEDLIENLSAISAVDKIQAMSEETKIVMINEAHHIALHRTLTASLLQKLWSSGYRYLAIETLSKRDVDINIRGYAIERSGTYSNEPVYAEMIRTAKKLGYQIIAYDDSGSEREKKAAENIFNATFSINKNAKVIVHCGYSHILEKNIKDKRIWLANELANLTGINPLTISQTNLMESKTLEFENPIYNKILNKFNPKIPIVLTDNLGLVWSTMPGQHDVDVIWPRTTYTNTRPDWYIQNYDLIAFEGRWCRNKYPCIIEIRRGNELNAIPFDRLRIEVEPNENVVLRLPLHESIIFGFNEHGEKVFEEKINASKG
ncbi:MULTISPECIES: hypothetical protein [Shewanella]|uniref:hypothetical protein n=1 Tax=Shewanella TaxID=22 RepID=UPI00217DA4FB|nr:MULTISPECIES: hypothetical protein [Shewanella]MCS6100812.1 hypothetical protein [Shewanella baltica]MCS6183504.1 hypothetical protein [Shewanella baltica]